ncbi:MAG: AAA family ATPase, partial [Phycisphaerae bacterium]
MILKKLIAHGFKSFADRTEFEFERGVTAIVGPNGCGKSNVVDAIRWVLGEQSAKSLRGKQMLDVIFNGSSTRRSSGMAQIDLVFDNSDGRLPLDQSEVIVSRRLLRSGESEYLLNKQACRLRDVKELFMDTGIGVDAYSVIEQGRVDALLQANPLERRTIFEEAAGISKFKARKKEAQRKLERVEQNLLRLQDIIDEIEKRLRSIKLAAGKARNYQQYAARLAELRSRYALAMYDRQRREQAELEQQAAALSDESTGLRTRLSDSETRTSQAQVRVAELEQEIQTVDSGVLTTQSHISAHEERITAAKQQKAERAQTLENTRARADAIERQIADLQRRLDDAEQRHGVADTEVESLQSTVLELDELERRISSELQSHRRELEDEKSGVIDLLRRTSTLNNEVENLQRQHGVLVGQKDKLAARDAEVARHLADLMARRNELESRRAELDRLVTEQTTALQEARTQAGQAAEQRAQQQERLAAAKEYRSGLQARRQTLDELDRRRDGLVAGVREVLARRDADPSGAAFGYVLGPVGELFETDVAHAGLIEAVLGAVEQFLVVASRDALLADRDVLAKIDGRVQAFCLDR